MVSLSVYQAAQVARQGAMGFEAGIAKQLASQYLRVYGQLQAEVDALAQTADPSKFRIEQLNSLKVQVKAELDKYGAWADTEIIRGAETVVDRTKQSSVDTVFAGLPNEYKQLLAPRFQHLESDTLISLMGFMQPDSILRQKMTKDLGDYVSQQVADGLFTAIARGWNPRRIAGQFRRDMGMGLTQALRTSRTVMMYAHRDATLERYRANPNICRGWEWMAAHSPRTCMGCIAMDGTIHPLSEPLNDHHSGRCAAGPVTPSWRELGLPVDEEPAGPTGKDWFATQPEDVQRAMFKNNKLFEAWKEGKVPWDKLVTTYQDPAFGEMRRQASYTEIFGRGKAGTAPTKPQAPSAPRFGNVKEAEDWLKGRFGGLADLSGYTTEEAQTIADAIVKGVGDHNNLQMEVVGKGAGKHLGVYWYRGDKGALKLNRTYIKNAKEREKKAAFFFRNHVEAKKKTYQPWLLDVGNPERVKYAQSVLENISDRWSTSVIGNPVESLIYHEMGHKVYHDVTGNFFESEGLWRQISSDAGITAKDIARVSEYAGTNGSELFAETHALNVLGRRDLVPSIIQKAYELFLKGG